MPSIDGTTGEVFVGARPLVAGDAPDDFYTILGWADAIRKGKLAVRANADTGKDAAQARSFGAEICEYVILQIQPGSLLELVR